MINERLTSIREKISEAAVKGGYDPGDVKLVAVTKNVSTGVINEAVKTGITDLGENRLQEALPKIAGLPEDINWHFIGYLQTNKVKDVIDNFSLIHSLDRWKLAQALEKRAQQTDTDVAALVQINTSGEETKYGLAPEELEDFLTDIKELKRVKVKGLMSMAPFTEDPEETRPYFRMLRDLKEKTEIPGIELRYLSMGMTNDYHIAVEEGANIVRVGTALFGGRT